MWQETDSSPGSLFTKRADLLSQDLVNSRSRKIGFYNDRYAVKFNRNLGSATTEVHVKFQRDWKSLNPNLTAPTLYDMSR